jgi:hypothetical protein
MCRSQPADKYLGRWVLFCNPRTTALNVSSDLLRNLRPWMPTLFLATGFAGTLGMSMCLAVISDFLALFSLHIYLGYSIMNIVYQKQLSTLYSLFNLFRGDQFVVETYIDQLTILKAKGGTYSAIGWTPGHTKWISSCSALYYSLWWCSYFQRLLVITFFSHW